MNHDIVLAVIIIINIAGFFISSEQPAWVFYIRKWTTIRLGSDSNESFSFNILTLAVFIFIVATTSTDNIFLSTLFSIAVILYTSAALFKLINAFLPPQRESYAIVKVLDSFVFSIHGKGGGSRQYVLIKANVPQAGVHILPAFRFDSEIDLHPNSNLSVFYRKGGLGLLYRFVFDRT